MICWCPELSQLSRHRKEKIVDLHGHQQKGQPPGPGQQWSLQNIQGPTHLRYDSHIVYTKELDVKSYPRNSWVSTLQPRSPQVTSFLYFGGETYLKNKDYILVFLPLEYDTWVCKQRKTHHAVKRRLWELPQYTPHSKVFTRLHVMSVSLPVVKSAFVLVILLLCKTNIDLCIQKVDV